MIRLAALLLVTATAAGAETAGPAELPPADFAGLQYVDSQGCVFARAGTGDKVLWIPRVSRQGAPVCDYPPSGRRVPVGDEAGAQKAGAQKAGAQKAGAQTAGATGTATAATAETVGGYFVAVGSYGHQENADHTEARLVELGYRVIRGSVQGASGTLMTVFVGPFPDQAAAVAAQRALRADGFADALLSDP